MASTAGYLARRAAQKERVRLLYRRTLKDTLNWAVHRHIFYQDASDLRDKFEANRHVVKPSRADFDNLDVIDRLIDDAEAQYRNFQHPDPYIEKLRIHNVILGFLYRDYLKKIEIVYNYGKED
ncbi:NADH dehydrogenase [ubiquinone] 1 beta subcomplex subunit 9 [Dichanthelium oligosanthes]|uniref:NADH dehydrogenase [ubiquinone] 1 beta subcomplex subunit 9 n=1 Tax=Dichanthelium oligosanthes TaxID=888268 RepID=A0A1E5VLF0_9POAL|nr:NADH dehydrogenase [ubiquinone] 1 beta subcomplex subunit 9 [Dichanthelium oligosanthes]